MSFLAGKISTFQPIQSLEDLLSRNINNYFSAVDRDLQNLFQMSSPAIQFTGIGEQYQIPQSNGDGTYTWTGDLGGWSFNDTLLWSGTTSSYIGLQPGTGIWLGDEAFLSAPFSIDPAGVLHAHSGNIAGWTLSETKLASGIDTSYIALIPATGIQMGKESFNDAPFTVTTAGVLKAESGVLAGWSFTDSALYSGSGVNHIEFKPTEGIWLGADAIGQANFAVDRSGIMRATLANITGSIIQTSADPGADRVVINSAGLHGYDASLGLTFRLPTDGSAPLFSSGYIQSATIVDTTMISNEFYTASELPWLEMTATGMAYRETVATGKYGSGVQYGDGTFYGVGVTAYYANPSYPVLSVQAERTLADLRLYNRSSVPSGASVIGDFCFKSNRPIFCTTAGTPGTYLYGAVSDGTTGGSGSAGAGNQYIELDIGGTTYKVLHDGTV